MKGRADELLVLVLGLGMVTHYVKININKVNSWEVYHEAQKNWNAAMRSDKSEE